MSNITAVLDESTINRIFAQTVIRGSLTREVKDPIFATKLVTVTLNYEAKEFRAHVQEGGIRFTAKVHAASGVFTYEVAETKVTQVMDFSRQHQHPLQCVMEKK